MCGRTTTVPVLSFRSIDAQENVRSARRSEPDRAKFVQLAGFGKRRLKAVGCRGLHSFDPLSPSLLTRKPSTHQSFPEPSMYLGKYLSMYVHTHTCLNVHGTIFRPPPPAPAPTSPTHAYAPTKS